MRLLRIVQISNHPHFPDVERYVRHYGFVKLSSRTSTMQIEYDIQYIRDGVDVSASFNPYVEPWIVDNSYKVFVLDENGNVIQNMDWEPNYPVIDGLTGEIAEEPDNSDDQWQRMPAFDYFLELSYFNPNPVSIGDLLEKYTKRDDLVIKRFDPKSAA